MAFEVAGSALATAGLTLAATGSALAAEGFVLTTLIATGLTGSLRSAYGIEPAPIAALTPDLSAPFSKISLIRTKVSF